MLLWWCSNMGVFMPFMRDFTVERWQETSVERHRQWQATKVSSRDQPWMFQFMVYVSVHSWIDSRNGKDSHGMVNHHCYHRACQPIGVCIYVGVADLTRLRLKCCLLKYILWLEVGWQGLMIREHSRHWTTQDGCMWGFKILYNDNRTLYPFSLNWITLNSSLTEVCMFAWFLAVLYREVPSQIFQ